MQKTVLSLSVAAALAVPALASAQATAPAAPTLDKVLEASGISMSGYIDSAYTHSDRDIQGGFSPRVFDSYNNSFVLHQVGLQIAKQPKSGVGGLVNVTAGRDATVIHSSPDTSSSTFDITQGFLQYATGPITVMAGKFTTLHGTEVIWSPSNANYSRSLLFGSVPFTHTGVRVNVAPMDNLTVTAGLNNGWDQLTDSNRDKTLELGITATPIKPLTLNLSYYGGQEPSATTGITGRKDSYNFVAAWQVIDPLSLGLELLRVQQKEAVFDSSGTATKGKYSGIAAYLSYSFMPKLKGSLRMESFDDKDGLRFGMPAGTTEGSKYREYTVTLGYLAADNFELRGEIRQDRANNAVFSENATTFSKSLTTYAVQALYKF